MPERLRMLGGPRGDLPRGGFGVHAALRLLPDRHRQAGSARRGRAAPGRRVGARPRAALRHRDRSRPRRPARRRVLDLRRDVQADPRPMPRHRRGAARRRLPGGPRRIEGGDRLPPGGLRPQPGDGAAHLQEDPPRLPLRALAGRHRHGLRGGAGHQVQPHPRHGGDARGDRTGHGRPPRQFLRPADDHPVPAPVRPPPPDRPLGQTAGIPGLAEARGADGLRRRHGRAARTLLLPRGPPVRQGDESERPAPA